MNTSDYTLLLIGSVGSALIAMVLVSMALSDGAYAATSFVKTNKSEYVHGEPIIIFGTVGSTANNQTLEIVLEHVSGETVYSAENVPISQDGSFNYSFSLSEGYREGAYFI